VADVGKVDMICQRHFKCS